MITRKIDWLAFSTDSVSLFERVFSYYKPILERKTRSRFYYDVFQGQGVSISSGPRNKNLKSFMVEISGKGTLRPDFFQAVVQEVLVTEKTKIFRVDLAYDHVSYIGDFESTLWPDVVTPKRGLEKIVFHVDGQYSGFKIGKADFCFRYYDKGREQKALPLDAVDWWRAEIVVRGDLAKSQRWDKDIFGTGIAILRKRIIVPEWVWGIDQKLEGYCSPVIRATKTASTMVEEEKIKKMIDKLQKKLYYLRCGEVRSYEPV